jgi:folylpolyglutamate synthase/dihydrofolate synthase
MSAIEAAGLRVGCFTSPHLFDVRERFTIGADLIPADAFERHSATVLAFNQSRPEDDRIGAFEFLFLTALLWFQDERPDAIVWEAGIGGRYDPVRAVRASVSVLTSIELEHTELLGSTEELIAYDKIDAVAPGGCVILSPSIPEKLATRIAAFAGLSGKATLPALTSRRLGPVTNHPKGARFTYGFTATTPEADHLVKLKLAGRHQVDNAVTALRAAEVWLGLKPEENAERHITMLGALRQTTWPGRLQKVAENPELWIDVGHTPCALEAVTRTFQEFMPAREDAGRLRRLRQQGSRRHLAHRRRALRSFHPDARLQGGGRGGAVRADLPRTGDRHHDRYRYRRGCAPRPRKGGARRPVRARNRRPLPRRRSAARVGGRRSPRDRVPLAALNSGRCRSRCGRYSPPAAASA